MRNDFCYVMFFSCFKRHGSFENNLMILFTTFFTLLIAFLSGKTDQPCTLSFCILLSDDVQVSYDILQWVIDKHAF